MRERRLRHPMMGAASAVLSAVLASAGAPAMANMAPPLSVIVKHATAVAGAEGQALRRAVEGATGGRGGAGAVLEATGEVRCPSNSGGADYACVVTVPAGTGGRPASVTVGGPAATVMRGKLEMATSLTGGSRAEALASPVGIRCAGGGSESRCDVSLADPALKP